MAYEHRIFIVEKTHDCYDAKVGKYFGKVLCVFNLGVVDELFNFVTKYRPTDHFIYQPGNGDEEVVEDMYGDPSTEIPVDDMFQDLQCVMTTSDTVQINLILCYETLKTFRHLGAKGRNNDIVCLHYGY